MDSLTDRVAIVTGAASGIGRATATAFAAAGCRVAAADIDTEGLEQTRRIIDATADDPQVLTHELDVSDAAAVDDFADAVVDRFGAAHILVNNAGINVTGTFEEHSLDDFRRTFDVNLWGVIHGCRAFLPHLKRADQAHIVNISSLFGIVGVAGQSAYCASKFAVRGLTETLHEELADTAVDVTVVHPGCVNTNIIADATIHDETSVDDIQDYFTRHGCDPETVADRIVAAVRDGDHRVMVTAESRLFDWLRRLVPTAGNRLANRLMSRVVGITPD